MLLRETALTYQPELGPHVLDFNRCASIVTEGYDEARPTVRTAGTAKLAVTLWGEPMPRTLRTYYDVEPIGKYGNYVDELHVPFDLDLFLAADRYERRKLLLDQLHNNAVRHATRRNWPVEPFVAAYSNFVNNGLRPIWRSKPVSDKSRNASAWVEGEFDEAATWFTVVVASLSGEIIARSDPTDLAHRGLDEVRTRTGKVRWSNSAEVVVESRPHPGFTEPVYPPFIFRVPGI